MEAAALRVIENFACTGCGCVCDDLRLTVEGDAIVRAEKACFLAEPWLLGQNRTSPPACEVDGKLASTEHGIERAAAILREASYPLIYGLARSSTEGQSAAVALAETLGANIDSTASLCHAPSVIAQQEAGKPTCTLGEVRNRADLVIFWGSDPLVTHPRHWERYSVFPPGRRVAEGRKDRFVVVADTKPTASTEAADLFLPIEPGKHFEALVTLRALLKGVRPEKGESYGVPLELLESLVERIRAAQCGIFFFGVDLARGPAGHCNVQVLFQMVEEMNVPARWFAMRMRVQGNVVGADSVLLWQTGYPFAVNMARGYPRYNPGEFSVEGLLTRQEADACVLVGSETLAWLSPEAIAHLRRIPCIVLDAPDVDFALDAAVRFRTAVPGVHTPGTAYRMDGVPISLRAVIPSRYLSDEEVLTQIRRRLTISN